MGSLDDHMRSIREQEERIASEKAAWEAVRFVTSEEAIIHPPLKLDVVREFIDRAGRRRLKPRVLCNDPNGVTRMTRFQSIDEAVRENYMLDGKWRRAEPDKARVKANKAAAKELWVAHAWEIVLYQYYSDGDVTGELTLFEDATWVPSRDWSFQAWPDYHEASDPWHAFCADLHARAGFDLPTQLAKALLSMDSNR
jgi:hypothetical protein